LANAWQQPARVLHAVRELPSPAGMPVAERGAWLRTALVGTIDSLGSAQIAWRDGIIEALSELSARSDAVIVSHFVVNNAVVAHANGDRRVCVFRPAHTSITIVDVERSDSGAATIRVVELGGERITSIR
jgi:broad specificity phosphatase PhoE